MQEKYKTNPPKMEKINERERQTENILCVEMKKRNRKITFCAWKKKKRVLRAICGSPGR